MKRRAENMRRRKAIVILTITLASSFALNAQSPMISYQGKITETGGALLDGIYSVRFCIYGQETGGTTLWCETNPAVTVEKGIFNVLLGSITPFPSNLFNGDVRCLGVKVGTDPEMSPRQQIVSVGYALKADKANEANDSDKLDNHDSNYFATADHTHSITGDDIEDGTIDEADISFTIPDGHSLDAADGEPKDVVYVNDSGNVGIGTTNPSEKLEVTGHIRASMATGSAQLSLMGPTGGEIYSPDKLRIMTGGAESMQILSNGNVGIGTGLPEVKLHVEGSARMSSNVEIGNINISPIKALTVEVNRSDWTAYFKNTHSTAHGVAVTSPNAVANNYIFEVLGNGGDFWIKSNGDVGGNHGTYHTSSDIRLKKNVRTIPDALDKVMSLRGVNFNWQDPEKEQDLQMGMIAQEVEQVVSEVVHNADDEMKTKSVEYQYLVALLIEAVKEQQKQIEILHDRILEIEASSVENK